MYMMYICWKGTNLQTQGLVIMKKRNFTSNIIHEHFISASTDSEKVLASFMKATFETIIPYGDHVLKPL